MVVLIRSGEEEARTRLEMGPRLFPGEDGSRDTEPVVLAFNGDGPMASTEAAAGCLAAVSDCDRGELHHCRQELRGGTGGGTGSAWISHSDRNLSRPSIFLYSRRPISNWIPPLARNRQLATLEHS